MLSAMGKSGGALIQQFMILSFGSLANSTPYLGGILLVIVLAWLAAARSLESQFSSLAKEELVREKEAVGAVKNKVVEVPQEPSNGSVGKQLEDLEEEKIGNGSVNESVASEINKSPETTTPHIQ